MLRPRKSVITIVDNRNKQKKIRWKITKAKRIAQGLFQAEIDASIESTTARSEPREIQTQQLMPVRVSR